MINWPVEQPTMVHGEITLRPLKETDIDPIFQACQDPTITAFTRVPYPYERSMAEEFVRESDTTYRNHHSISFAIEFEGEFVGTIGLHSLSLGDHTSEVGYWMDPNFRAKGICTQALKALSDFAIKHQRTYSPERRSANGWAECECEVNGEWINAGTLRV
jgi:RimJ/RimL family protein N-acetyltransferase